MSFRMDWVLHHCHLLLFPGQSNRMRESGLKWGSLIISVSWYTMMENGFTPEDDKDA